MPRITKKRLAFTKDSMLEVLQECYYETHNIRQDTIILINKWKPKATEKEDIAMIGKQLVDLMTKRENVLGKKLEVVRIMKDIVYSDVKTSKANTPNSNDENEDLYSFAEELKETIKNSKLGNV
jgi:hypothetical protein